MHTSQQKHVINGTDDAPIPNFETDALFLKKIIIKEQMHSTFKLANNNQGLP